MLAPRARSLGLLAHLGYEDALLGEVKSFVEVPLSFVVVQAHYVLPQVLASLLGIKSKTKFCASLENLVHASTWRIEASTSTPPRRSRAFFQCPAPSRTAHPFEKQVTEPRPDVQLLSDTVQKLVDVCRCLQAVRQGLWKPPLLDHEKLFNEDLCHKPNAESSNVG